MRALQCRGKAFSQPKPGDLLLQWHSSCFMLASCLDFPQRKVMETLTVASAVRPNRIAVLTDVNDPNWASNCRHILEYFAQLWGG